MSLVFCAWSSSLNLVPPPLSCRRQVSFSGLPRVLPRFGARAQVSRSSQHNKHTLNQQASLRFQLTLFFHLR
ncbi:hypothetical protein WJX82_003617 [Trebouxia sp. C0006]